MISFGLPHTPCQHRSGPLVAIRKLEHSPQIRSLCEGQAATNKLLPTRPHSDNPGLVQWLPPRMSCLVFRPLVNSVVRTL